MRGLVCVFSLLALFSAATSQAELPSEDPDSAYFVTSCNQIVFAIIRVNGKELTFDRFSQESADDVKRFAMKAKQPARVYEVGCFEIEDRTAT